MGEGKGTLAWYFGLGGGRLLGREGGGVFEDIRWYWNYMYTIANGAISSEPLFTNTAEGTVGVDALGVNITLIGISGTLIDIYQEKMQTDYNFLFAMIAFPHVCSIEVINIMSILYLDKLFHHQWIPVYKYSWKSRHYWNNQRLYRTD